MSIFRYSPHKWRVDVRGKFRRLSRVVSGSKKSAKIVEAELTAAANTPRPEDSDKWKTLGSLLAAYLDDARLRNKTPSETESQVRVILSLIPPETPVHQVTRSSISRFVATRRESGVSSNTIDRQISTLKAAYNFAAAEGAAVGSPVAGMRRLGRPNPRNRVLAVDELLAVLAFLPDDLVRVVIAARWTGIRLQSLLSLRLDQLGDGVVLAPQGDDRQTTKRFGTPPLAPSLADLLRDGARDGFCFPGQKRKTHRVHVQRPLELARAASGVDFRFHDLRRTFATSLRRDFNVSLELRAAMMGHGPDARFLSHIRHYQVIGIDEVQRIAAVIEADEFFRRCVSIASNKEVPNVVQLRNFMD